MVSTDQLWRDYLRLGSTIKVAELHGYKNPNNVSQRLRKKGYQLHRPGRRPSWDQPRRAQEARS